MCRLKCYSLSQKCVWRIVSTTGCMLLVLGATSFGFGMKLMEFADKPDITPVFAGIPMMGAGFLGLASGLCKKGWLVTFYGIGCVIISMLSIHMNYRFMGKELPLLPMYKDQCQNEPEIQYQCDKYFGTAILCSTAVAMLPFILVAFLSCIAAKRTLRKKNCCIIWFTCGKVEPSLPISYSCEKVHRYKQTKKNKPVGLRYKDTSSKGFVCEIPETRPTAEYLPQIPDFTDLAGRPDSPGYPASVMFQFENQDSQSRVSRADEVKLHRENYGLSKSNDQGLALIESGIPQEDCARTVQRWKNHNSGVHGVAHSEADLNLLEQDYLNRRSYLDDEENDEYYDRAAEEWIQKMVDNVHDSRSRLYAVSDEEDLDDVPKRKTSSGREGSVKFQRKASRESESGQSGTSYNSGSTPPLETRSHEGDGNIDDLRKTSIHSEYDNTMDLSIKMKSSPNQETNDFDSSKSSRIDKPFLAPRTRKHGTSSPSDSVQDELKYYLNANNPNTQSEAMETYSQSETSNTASQSEPLKTVSQSESSKTVSQSELLKTVSQSEPLKTVSQSESSKTVSQSEPSKTASQSEPLKTVSQSEPSNTDSQSYSSHNSKLEEVPQNMTREALLSIERLGTGGITPHDIVTPTGQAYPTGALHFDFDKATPNEHARKHWVEFEGEAEDRKKLLKGKMPLKEYEELTSYLM